MTADALHQEPVMDRRQTMDRRSQDPSTQTNQQGEDRRQGDRRKNRRRQIDPTTCERDYSGDEIEFMQALDVYKRDNGRMFPTCSEVLEVLRSLGYVKLSETGEVIVPVSSAPQVEESEEDWEE